MANKEYTGLKYDSDKLRFDLIMPEFDEEVARVLTYGANKYAPNSWQDIEDPVNRYYGSLMRHINAWRKGEKHDKESGLLHLSHAASNIMFILHKELQENSKDE